MEAQTFKLEPLTFKSVVKAVMVYGFGVQAVIILLPLWIAPVLAYNLIVLIYHMLRTIIKVWFDLSRVELLVWIMILSLTFIMVEY